MPRSALAQRTADVPGRFGAYGGRYVPETLMAALQELESAYEKGVKVRGKNKRDLEERLQRDPVLQWWDITIQPKKV